MAWGRGAAARGAPLTRPSPGRDGDTRPAPTLRENNTQSPRSASGTRLHLPNGETCSWTSHFPLLFLSPRCPRDHQPSSDLQNPHLHGARACVDLCARCRPETGAPKTGAAFTGRERRVLTLELRRWPNYQRRGRQHCTSFLDVQNVVGRITAWKTSALWSEPTHMYLTQQKGLYQYDLSLGVFQDFTGPILIMWALKSRGLSWVGRQRGNGAEGSQRFNEGLEPPLVALKTGKEHQ